MGGPSTTMHPAPSAPSPARPAPAPGADALRPTPPVMAWTGRVLSALVVAMLTMSAVMKFLRPPEVVEGFTKLGYSESIAVTLGIVEIAAALIYAVPQTAVLGAILLTGYLGGAIATHVRVADPFIMPVVIGVVVWLALFLRDRRLRALLPLRSLARPN